jgi:ABC-type transport system involved in Fe-S cluster assembly fused permease/ATPase subunit
VDSLLNYETVKYFNNEGFEARRYDESLERLRRARLKSQTTLSMLNTGQQLIIAVGLVAMLWRATQGVVDGRMTLGDLVMVNAFMIQLYIPLNFLGVIYREIKQSLTDLDKMFTLMEQGARGGGRHPAPCRWRATARRAARRPALSTPACASTTSGLCLRRGAAHPARHQL